MEEGTEDKKLNETTYRYISSKFQVNLVGSSGVTIQHHDEWTENVPQQNPAN